MRYSGVGGQAVMEGVMMKNQEKYAVAVRKPDQEIAIKVSEYKGIVQNKKIRNLPIVRGVLSFIESLYLGMSTLTYSASFFEEEEDGKTPKEKTKKDEKKDAVIMGGTVAFSIVLALAIFFVLPYYLSGIFGRMIESSAVLALVEGLIRLAIFIGYIALISLMPDIKRVFMYHGAEHKCINCIEHGMELNVENVRKAPNSTNVVGQVFCLLLC